MSVTDSDFFAVTLIGDVTVIQLIEATEYRRRPTTEFDLDAFLHQLLEPPRPEPLPIWQRLGNDLRTFLASNKPGKVVLDFAGLGRIGDEAVVSTPMNSAFLSVIAQSVTFGCQWRICGLMENACEIYKGYRIDELLQIHDTQSEALAAFSVANARST